MYKYCSKGNLKTPCLYFSVHCIKLFFIILYFLWRRKGLFHCYISAPIINSFQWGCRWHYPLPRAAIWDITIRLKKEKGRVKPFVQFSFHWYTGIQIDAPVFCCTWCAEELTALLDSMLRISQFCFGSPAMRWIVIFARIHNPNPSRHFARDCCWKSPNYCGGSWSWKKCDQSFHRRNYSLRLVSRLYHALQFYLETA